MHGSKSTERGAAVVEFALILPVLMLIFSVIVDYSYRYDRVTLVNTAAQIAARDIAVNHASGIQPASAQAKAMGVFTSLTSSNFHGASLTTSMPTTCVAGDNVTVMISVTVNKASALGGTFTATGKGVARCSE